MNAMQGRMIPTKDKPTAEYYFRHYVNLLWRWKWYICIITPAVFAAWTFFALKFGYTRPALESRVILQLVQGGSMNPVDEQAMNLQQSSCDAFIKSRWFLEKIVQTLALQVTVEKYFRNDIFDSIFVEPNATPGRYDFVIDKDSYTLYFTNKLSQVDKRTASSGKLFELSSFAFPSLFLKLTRDFIAEPHDFSFNVSKPRNAAEKLSWTLSTKFPREEGEMKSIMLISLKGNDYPLTTQVVNAIADDFVAHNFDLKRSRKSEAVEMLERQMQAARSSLASADEAMRQFREANPSIGATSAMSSSMTEVASLEGTSSSIQRSINEAVALQARCTGSATIEDQITTLFEAITFLTTRQAVAAPALQIELNDVAAEKRRVDADYAPQHPAAIENRKKITRVASNISKALSDLIDKMRAESVSVTSRKSMLSEEFRKLPAKELRYSELERRRAMANELYSGMLARYNVNKMSEGPQVNDVVVLDHALPPMAPGRLATMMQLLLIGLAIAISLGFGPPVGLDYLDKRVRNEDDCRRLSSLPYLEGIPAKVIDKKKKRADKEKIDAFLVAASFEADVFDEMYRSLRTKILLRLHDEKNKMLVVTSLNVGEGKSLTTSNISIVMAQQKLRTLLIDGDLRRGVQHHSFVLQKKPGLSDILSSPDELTTMPINSMIQQTHIPNLSLLACGMPVPNPAECMNSQKFRDLTTMLTDWFDVIILDTPPLRVAVDAAILPEAFNNYVVVVYAAKTNIVALEKKINEFPGLRQKVLGIVLNGAPVDQKARDYRYSYYQT